MRTAFACPWLHAEKINIEKRKILKINKPSWQVLQILQCEPKPWQHEQLWIWGIEPWAEPKSATGLGRSLNSVPALVNSIIPGVPKLNKKQEAIAHQRYFRFKSLGCGIQPASTAAIQEGWTNKSKQHWFLACIHPAHKNPRNTSIIQSTDRKRTMCDNFRNNQQEKYSFTPIATIAHCCWLSSPSIVDPFGRPSLVRLDWAVATHNAHGLLDARELSKGNDIDTSAAKDGGAWVESHWGSCAGVVSEGRWSIAPIISAVTEDLTSASKPGVHEILRCQPSWTSLKKRSAFSYTAVTQN